MPVSFTGKLLLHNTMDNPYYYLQVNDTGNKIYRIKLDSLTQPQYYLCMQYVNSNCFAGGLLDIMHYKMKPGEKEEKIIYLLRPTIIKRLNNTSIEQDTGYSQDITSDSVISFYKNNLPA